MLCLLLSLVLPLPQNSPADVSQIKAAVAKAYETYAQQARKLNGTVSLYGVDGEKKKLLQKVVVKTDTKSYLIHEMNGEQRFVSAYLYRPSGDVRQVLTLTYNTKLKAPYIQDEKYRKKGEAAPPIALEDTRMFASEAPATIGLRPATQWSWTLQDMFDCPAFKVISAENIKQNNTSLVKIVFEVDKELDSKQPDPVRMYGIEKGTITLRPDQFWTVQSSEMLLQAEPRRPARIWKTEYVFGASPAGSIPVVKEARLSAAEGKSADQKPLTRLYEFDFKAVEGTLPEDQFSLQQFNVKERTVADWQKEEDERARAEAEEKAQIAKLPADKLKPASAGLQISPWVLLYGGFGAFVLVFLVVLFSTGRKSPPPLTPVPGSEAPPAV